jgi:hypothetical protein
MKTEIDEKIMNWFATGRVGISSKAMACAVAGLRIVPRTFGNHPADPDDFNRCLLLLEAVPEIREQMDKVAALSKTWSRLVDRWDEVEQCFLMEVGLDWANGRSAPETYKLMKEIGC